LIIEVVGTAGKEESPMNSKNKKGQLGPVKPPPRNEKLPPNENLKRLPDEAYGDTKIPGEGRKRSN